MMVISEGIGVFKNQSNIYNGFFFKKIVHGGRPFTIFAKKPPS